MPKTIDTLAKDIQNVLGSGHVLDLDTASKFGVSIANHMSKALAARTRPPPNKVLRVSEFGKPCHRQLWYGRHKTHLAEPMSAHTLFKFAYGDILEEATLLLAQAAGHTVEHRQNEVGLKLNRGWYLVGHIDAVIDDVLVDVKSCSSFGFRKFKDGLTEANDDFGYKYQLSTYQLLHKAPSGRQAFLAVEKQNGYVGVFDDKPLDVDVLFDKMDEVVEAIESPSPPMIKAQFDPVKFGASGNFKLCTACSYCPFKIECWKSSNYGKGLRAFDYAGSPVFLTATNREPAVDEITLNPVLKE